MINLNGNMVVTERTNNAAELELVTAGNNVNGVVIWHYSSQGFAESDTAESYLLWGTNKMFHMIIKGAGGDRAANQMVSPEPFTIPAGNSVKVKANAAGTNAGNMIANVIHQVL